MIQDYKCRINLTDYDFACLMVDVYPILLITKLQNKIDLDDLDDKGIETNQHITVVYGIDTYVGLSRMLTMIPKNIGTLKLGKISVFENEKYDVLKVSIIPSNELLKLRSDIVNKLHVTLTYPNFEPHITLAYLKKGTAAKYLLKFGNIDLSNEVVVFDKYNYSGGNLNETFIKL